MSLNRFFVFEGVEGSGKSTLIDSVLNSFSKSSQVIKTREPGGTNLGTKIREVLLHSSKNETPISPISELLLFYADRAQHINEVIKPAINQNKIVLCDRYVYSTIAYQVYARGIDRQIINSLNNLVVKDTIPSGVILLDIDPEISMLRVKSRGEADRFEKEKISFHQKIRQGYLELAQELPNLFLVLDANQSPNILLDLTIDFIKDRL